MAPPVLGLVKKQNKTTTKKTGAQGHGPGSTSGSLKQWLVSAKSASWSGTFQQRNVAPNATQPAQPRLAPHPNSTASRPSRCQVDLTGRQNTSQQAHGGSTGRKPCALGIPVENIQHCTNHPVRQAQCASGMSHQIYPQCAPVSLKRELPVSLKAAHHQANSATQATVTLRSVPTAGKTHPLVSTCKPLQPTGWRASPISLRLDSPQRREPSLALESPGVVPDTPPSVAPALPRSHSHPPSRPTARHRPSLHHSPDHSLVSPIPSPPISPDQGRPAHGGTPTNTRSPLRALTHSAQPAAAAPSCVPPNQFNPHQDLQLPPAQNGLPSTATPAATSPAMPARPPHTPPSGPSGAAGATSPSSPAEAQHAAAQAASAPDAAAATLPQQTQAAMPPRRGRFSRRVSLHASPRRPPSAATPDALQAEAGALGASSTPQFDTSAPCGTSGHAMPGAPYTENPLSGRANGGADLACDLCGNAAAPADAQRPACAATAGRSTDAAVPEGTAPPVTAATPGAGCRSPILGIVKHALGAAAATPTGSAGPWHSGAGSWIGVAAATGRPPGVSGDALHAEGPDGQANAAQASGEHAQTVQPSQEGAAMAGHAGDRLTDVLTGGAPRATAVTDSAHACTPTLASQGAQAWRESAPSAAAKGAPPQPLSAFSRRLLSLTPEARARLREAAATASTTASSPLRQSALCMLPGAAAPHSGNVGAPTPLRPGASAGSTALSACDLGGSWRTDGSPCGLAAAGGAGGAAVAAAAILPRPGQGDEGGGDSAREGAQGAIGCAWEDAATAVQPLDGGAAAGHGSYAQPAAEAPTPPLLGGTAGGQSGGLAADARCAVTPVLWGQPAPAAAAPAVESPAHRHDTEQQGWSHAPMIVHAVTPDAAEFGGMDDDTAGGGGCEAAGWGAGDMHAAAGVEDYAMGCDGDEWEEDCEWQEEAGESGSHMHAAEASRAGGDGGQGRFDRNEGREAGVAAQHAQQPEPAPWIPPQHAQHWSLDGNAAAQHSSGAALPGAPQHVPAAAPGSAPAAGPAARAVRDWDFDEELRWAEQQEEEEAGWAEPPQDMGPPSSRAVHSGGGVNGVPGGCHGGVQGGAWQRLQRADASMQHGGGAGGQGWPPQGGMHRGATAAGGAWGMQPQPEPGSAQNPPAQHAAHAGQPHGGAWPAHEQGGAWQRGYGSGGGPAAQEHVWQPGSGEPTGWGSAYGDGAPPSGWQGAAPWQAGGGPGWQQQQWDAQHAQHEPLRGAAYGGGNDVFCAPDGAYAAAPQAYEQTLAHATAPVATAQFMHQPMASAAPIDLTDDVPLAAPVADCSARMPHACPAAAPSAFDELRRGQAVAAQQPAASAAPGGSRAAAAAAPAGVRTLPGVAAAVLRMHDARQTCPDVYKAAGPPAGGLGRAGQPWWTALRDFVPLSELEDGRDPRTREPVYVHYSKQFEEAAGDGAGRGRKAGRKRGSRAAADDGYTAAAAAGGSKRGDKAWAPAAKRGGVQDSAQGAPGDGLGPHERRMLGDMDVDRTRNNVGGGDGGGRRREWDQVGQPALPAGRSTFTRKRPTAVHASGTVDDPQAGQTMPKSTRNDRTPAVPKRKRTRELLDLF
eukprot:jgi/Ulvmu1/6623/UM003_0261.1